MNELNKMSRDQMKKRIERDEKFLNSSLSRKEVLLDFCKWYKNQDRPQWLGLEETIKEYIKENGEKQETCPDCDGKGRSIEYYFEDGDPSWMNCRKCDGSGKLIQ